MTIPKKGGLLSSGKSFKIFSLVLIGILSDTHIPREAKALPPEVKIAFRGVDLILHAGDIYELHVLDELERLAPVMAARGNGDFRLPPDPRLKESHLLEIDGFKVGLTHGIEYPEPFFFPLEKTMQRYFGGRVDILIFGDSHVALVEEYKGVLLINPGSPTLPNGLIGLGTVALLKIAKGKAEAEILQLQQFSGGLAA